MYNNNEIDDGIEYLYESVNTSEKDFKRINSKSNIICPPETKCRDCDIVECKKNTKNQNVFARQNGKSKLTLANYINNCTEISQELKSELISMINQI